MIKRDLSSKQFKSSLVSRSGDIFINLKTLNKLSVKLVHQLIENSQPVDQKRKEFKVRRLKDVAFAANFKIKVIKSERPLQ